MDKYVDERYPLDENEFRDGLEGLYGLMRDVREEVRGRLKRHFGRRAEEVVILNDHVFLQEIELVIDRLEASIYSDGT